MKKAHLTNTTCVSKNDIPMLHTGFCKSICMRFSDEVEAIVFDQRLFEVLPTNHWNSKLYECLHLDVRSKWSHPDSLCKTFYWANPPPPRHQPQFRFLKPIRKQRGGGLVHAFRGAAFLLGADGVEIDKPRLEQRLRDGFEGGVGFAQEGDAVVEASSMLH